MEFNNNFKVELIQALEECEQYYEDVFNVAITKDEKYKIRLEPYKKGKLVLVEIYMDETLLENGEEWLIARREIETSKIRENIANFVYAVINEVESFEKHHNEVACDGLDKIETTITKKMIDLKIIEKLFDSVTYRYKHINSFKQEVDMFVNDLKNCKLHDAFEKCVKILEDFMDEFFDNNEKLRIQLVNDICINNPQLVPLEDFHTKYELITKTYMKICWWSAAVCLEQLTQTQIFLD